MPFQPLEPTDPGTVGPYQLLARLGAGGMGRVYLARSAGGRTVAVKVVRSELAEDQEFRERFRREVAAAQAVSGAYTAPVVDADRDGPTPWLATAYVLGPSLTEAVGAHGPLPVAAVRALGTGLAKALTAVHSAGLVHRDLKPSNVLLAADGPRVIDFGIARALDGDRLTSTGVVVGSPGFMCPEQAAGSPMGPPGDVFSLGSVLVYAATGAGPFSLDSDSAAALLYRVIHDEPALGALPAELRPAVTGCLAKNPADRPTPVELAELLDGGQAPPRGGWLPAALSLDIATHAAAVLDMETPARGTAHPPTALDLPAPSQPTLHLAATAAAPPPTVQAETAPAPSPDRPAGRPSRRLLLTGGGAALLAALGSALWAAEGHQPPHPGPTPPTPTAPASTTPTPTRAPGMPPVALWNHQFTHSTGGYSTPLCVAGLVLVNADGVTALGAADGKQHWADPQASGGVVVAAGGTVSYSTSDIVTADPATGALLWTYTAQKLSNPAAMLEDSTILAADDRAVYALGGYLPLDADGLPDDGKPQTPGIIALSRKDGSVLWSQHRAVGADSSVAAVLAKDTLLYTDSKTNLVARSTSTGEQLWFATTEAQALYPPATDGDRVYCSAAGMGLQGVAVAGGRQVWAKTPPQARLWYSPPTVAGGVVYAVLGGMTMTLDGTTYTPPAGPVLIAYRATDGTELWRLPLPDQCSMNVPSIAVQDTLFVPTDSKGIYAVDVKAHKVRWIFQNGVDTDIEWQFATDGKQLIALQDDRLYALPPV